MCPFTLLKDLLEFKVFILLESAVLMTVFMLYFHGRENKEKWGDKKAYLVHFLAVFGLFFVVPLITLLAYGKDPGLFGLSLGNAKQGFLLAGAGVCLALLNGLLSKEDDELTAFYPFSKEVLNNGKDFALYETAYGLLYYTGWEFFFRGFLLFGLSSLHPMIGVAVQVIPSTLLHINHPKSEFWAALIGGIFFGVIAYATGSVLYTWLIHAAMGIALDTGIYLRYKRSSRE